MLDNIKHSIVLLQISKNTAVPITGTFTGDKFDNGEDAQSSQGLEIASIKGSSEKRNCNFEIYIKKLKFSSFS